ncbi:MAG: COQ9 family protein, partial [Sphingomonadales bacterium]
DGWSMTALEAAARDLGVDVGLARLAFPGGDADLVEGYLDYELREFEAELQKRGLDNMKIREKITTAVRLRLELAEPHKEVSLRTARFLSRPLNSALAARHLWRTVDIMWRAAGDDATDFNHYSKRAILSAVYSSTFLYWLNDNSEGHHDTWDFLDRRIADVMQIEKAKARFRKANANRPKLTRFLGRLRYPAA